MRSVASEILSAAQVFLVPLGIALLFPYEAVRFGSRPQAGNSGEGAALAAFVTLDEAAERNLFRAVRMTWGEESGASQLRPEVFLAELPEEPPRPMLPIWARSRPPEPPLAACEPLPFLPSRKASPPQTITAEAPKEEPAFSKNELLKID